MGRFDLASYTKEVCPLNVELLPDAKDTMCPACQEATGFNPSFYYADFISPQQRAYNQTPHFVYLAYFSPQHVKAGISSERRGIERLLEQGEAALRLGEAQAHRAAAALVELLVGELGREAAARDDAEARGHAVELVEHVAGDHDRDAALVVEAHEREAHGTRGLGVEPVEGLVQEQQVGAAHERERQAKALPHAERVGLHAAMIERVESHEAEQVVRHPPRARHAERERLAHEVVARGETLQHARALDEGADAGEALRRGAAALGAAEEDDLARRRARQAADHLHGGRLARAVLAHEAVDVAGGDGHVQVVHGQLAAVALGEAARLDDVHAELLSRGRLPVWQAGL
mgnify:CR=1 FL=1